MRSRGTEDGGVVSDFQSRQIYNSSYHGYCWQYEWWPSNTRQEGEPRIVIMQEFLWRLHRDTHKLPCRCWGPAGTDEGQHLRQWRNSITNRLWWYWQHQEVAGKKPLFWLVSKRDLGVEDFKRKVHIRMGDNRDAGERILNLGSRDCTCNFRCASNWLCLLHILRPSYSLRKTDGKVSFRNGDAILSWELEALSARMWHWWNY